MNYEEKKNVECKIIIYEVMKVEVIRWGKKKKIGWKSLKKFGEN